MAKKTKSKTKTAAARAARLALLVGVAAVAYRTIVLRAAMPPPPPPPRLHAGGAALAAHLAAEHNSSLLWGTWRPGVYFGLRSRTHPTALVAGAMWLRADAVATKRARSLLRHRCEQDVLQRYGYSAHDGRSYATQQLRDAANGIVIDSSYALDQATGGWAVRLRGSNATAAQRVLFYVGLEASQPTAPTGALSPFVAAGSRLAAALGEGGVSIGGTVQQQQQHDLSSLPSGFSVLALGRSASGAALRTGTDGHASHGAVGRIDVTEVALGLVGDSDRAELAQRAPDGSQLILVQFETPPSEDWEVDIVLVPSIGGAREAEEEHAAAALRQMSGVALSGVLSARAESYAAAVDAMLADDALRLRGAPLSASARAFAADVIGSLFGSLGYFHGRSELAGGGATAAAPLFTVVPSRPFFPRGFLWDEGFHQLVLGAFDAGIADDALLHWLNLIDGDGWVAREQILGAEARAAVPDEFVAQSPEHANPPALLLRLERMGDDELAEWLAGPGRGAWPAIERWYGWLLRTQAGPAEHTYRWRGRDAGDGRLNAMTLASGLDDYPRACIVSAAEKHLDLLCWVAFCSRLLARIATALGHAEAAAAYSSDFGSQLEALHAHHWSEAAGAFCDWGVHANEGTFEQQAVIKCEARDGSSSVEALTPLGGPPRCPQAHPKFLFPLGDGKGGILMRDKFVPRSNRIKERHVHRLGYVTLFPLLLRLLPPDSPRLARTLELLADPKRLWSRYGLRSLSKADAWYGRENAPGDKPYWRGAIWININYLAIAALHHYARVDGPARHRAHELYVELRDNVVGTVLDEWERTGCLWEQYSPDDGRGQRNHPFSGWSALALLALAERF